MNKDIQSSLVARITALAEPVLAELNIELIEVQFRLEANGWILRLTIDTEVGVTVADCTRASREISALLEVEDIIEHAYRLEVSSPGLDRPLKKEEDFVRFTGRKAKITLKNPVEKQQVYTGILEKTAAGTIILATAKGMIDIPFANIAKARLEIDF